MTKLEIRKELGKSTVLKKKERYFGKYCYIQPANIAISIIMLSEFKI